MSIIQAMLSGVSALSNYGDAMTVISNNLANAQTTGFKASRSTFEDVLVQTIGISGTRPSTQIGTGVGLSSVDQVFQQGSLNTTSRVSDMAIDGKGYFIVRDAGLVPTASKVANVSTSASDTKRYYTRSGDFQKDKGGYLVNNSSMIVQGWALNEDGSRIDPSKLADINLSEVEGTNISIHEGKATSYVSVGANLDSRAEDNTIHSVTVRVYDSQGEGHNVSIEFTKSGANQWDWQAKISDTDTDNGSSISNGTGRLIFDDGGALKTEESKPIDFSFYTSGKNPTTPQQILFDFGQANDGTANLGTDMTSAYLANYDKNTLQYLTPAKALGGAGTGRNGVVQMASESTTLSQSQNGYGTGFLEEISVNQDGKLYGSYNNGQTIPLYQIAVADFPDEQGLDQVGSSLYQETNSSGGVNIGMAQTGRLGGIRSFVLEQSNVDMSGEFVNMIAMQRSFQANSRIVSVTDGMLEELLSLKR